MAQDARPTRRDMLGLFTGAPGQQAEAGEPFLVLKTQTCLAYRKVACRSCDDACLERAIRFRPRPGGHYVPELDAASCTACGECLGACPVGALSLEGQPANG